MNNLVPSYLYNKFTIKEAKFMIASQEIVITYINIPKYRTSAGQRTFRYRATKIWNTLEEPLKCITDLNHLPFEHRVSETILTPYPGLLG